MWTGNLFWVIEVETLIYDTLIIPLFLSRIFNDRKQTEMMSCILTKCFSECSTTGTVPVQQEFHLVIGQPLPHLNEIELNGSLGFARTPLSSWVPMNEQLFTIVNF